MRRYRLTSMSKVGWGGEREYFEDMKEDDKHGDWVRLDDANASIAEERERYSPLMEHLDRFLEQMVTLPSQTHPWDLYNDLKLEREKLRETS